MSEEVPISGEQGFSILEAMIAVAILAIAFLPLLELQSQFVKSVESFERAGTRVSLRQEVVHQLQTMNFALTQEGEFESENTRVTWRAILLNDTKPVEGEGRFSLGLYEVTATMVPLKGFAGVDKVTVTGLGWVPNTSYKESLF